MKQIEIKLSQTLKIGVFSLMAFLSTNISYSQDFGADLVSSYVWRGTQFGSGAHVQPYMTLGYENFEAGLWSRF